MASECGKWYNYPNEKRCRGGGGTPLGASHREVAPMTDPQHTLPQTAPQVKTIDCPTCGRRRHRGVGGECSTCTNYRRKHGEARPFGAGDGRAINARRGENHGGWKGDAATVKSGRMRARKNYRQLGTCERCGTPATDRHHRNGNTLDNSQENIAHLCRRCHMIVDGRLDRFRAINPPPKAPKPCAVCGRPSKPLRKGRCHACNEYFRRNEVDRPKEAL